MSSGYLSARGGDILFFLINLALFSGALVLLYRLQRSRVSFGNRVFAALGLGVLLGLILQFAYGSSSPATNLSLSWIGRV